MDFNLGKPLTGAGDMVHGRGIYTAKNKKTARVYKKHSKSKGLPLYLHEVDIPEDENLLDEEKSYEHRAPAVAPFCFQLNNMIFSWRILMRVVILTLPVVLGWVSGVATPSRDVGRGYSDGLTNLILTDVCMYAGFLFSFIDVRPYVLIHLGHRMCRV